MHDQTPDHRHVVCRFQSGHTLADQPPHDVPHEEGRRGGNRPRRLHVHTQGHQSPHHRSADRGVQTIEEKDMIERAIIVAAIIVEHGLSKIADALKEEV
jgi:hypothetical protein